MLTHMDLCMLCVKVETIWRLVSSCCLCRREPICVSSSSTGGICP